MASLRWFFDGSRHVYESLSRRTDVKTLNSQNFQAEVLESPIPVLVDFWSPRCRPCQLMEKPLEQAEAELGNGATFGKVNADENPDLVKAYGVLGLPTFLVFKGGKAVASTSGMTPKDKLKNLIATS
jgi:thioredoxin